MATAPEVRHKLTDKQYQLYSEARRQAADIGRQFEAARQQLAIAAELILDFYQVDLSATTSVDDSTKELVVKAAPAPAEVPPPIPKPVKKPKPIAPDPTL